MRNYEGLVHAAGAFARDRGGSFAVLFGLAASVLALSVGFAVNISQIYNAKSSLQGVVDAAVTSTARDLTTGVIKEADANKSVQAFLDANSMAGILQADQIVLDKLTVDRTAKTVKADAHVDVGPLLSAVQRRRHAACRRFDHGALFRQDVEVAMMLDVTGSMARPEDQGSEDSGKQCRRCRCSQARTIEDRGCASRSCPTPERRSMPATLADSSVFCRNQVPSQRKQAPANDDRRPFRHRRVRTTAPPSARTRTAMPIYGCRPRCRHGQTARYISVGLRAKRPTRRACPDAELMPLTADARRCSRA